MAGMIWVTDREPGIRDLFSGALPEAEALDPAVLEARLSLGQRPDALVIDGTQLLDLPPGQRDDLLRLPRVLICTGMLLASLPPTLVGGPNVAVLAKPFCIDDFEAAVDWLRDFPQLATHGADRGSSTRGRRGRSPIIGM
jgi:hypothetical protein